MTITRGSGNVFDDLEIPDPRRSVIEHVARAIAEIRRPHYDAVQIDHAWPAYKFQAQAAIKATLEKMKEPSEAMSQASNMLTKEGAPAYETITLIWQSMLEQFEKELED